MRGETSAQNMIPGSRQHTTMLSRAARSSSSLTFRAAGSSPSLLSPATRSAVASYSSSRRRSQRSSDDGIPASWYDARCRSTTILTVRKDDKVVS